MQITYSPEGDYVKGVKVECSPVEWLIISTGLELMADNSNLSIKDRRLAKKMIISVKDHDRLCKDLNNGGVLDKIRAELHATAEMHEDGYYYLREEWIDEIFDKYKAESEDKE